MMSVVLLFFAPAVTAATFAQGANWHQSKAMAHEALVKLVQQALINGPRALDPIQVHTEMAVCTLPKSYGLPSEPPSGLLTPDVVAVDLQRRELLIIEGSPCSLHRSSLHCMLCLKLPRY